MVALIYNVITPIPLVIRYSLFENCPEQSLPSALSNGPILKRMNVNFCATGYYKSKQKALKKPPLLEVNSEPLRRDW